jgi:excisionase family DNA binding protein
MAEELKQVADLITANTIFCTKEILTSDEAAKYMGISKSYLYKLTMRQQIPHYKPMGKMCYFNRQELEQWLQSNRVSTATELADKAMAYTQTKRVKL